MSKFEDVDRWTRGVMGFALKLLGEEGFGSLPWGQVYDEGVRGRVFGLRGVFGSGVGEQVAELVGEVVSCGC
jgi:hypothetical protein